MRATIISVGDELIRGEALDTNAPYAAKILVARGVEICKIVIVPDDIDAIAQEISDEGLNLIGGGLGGTHDDMTRAGIVKKTGLKLIEHPAAWAKFAERLKRRFPKQTPPQSIVEALQRMALAPAGAELVDNPVGAAPGFIVRKPVFILALPGVPAEFKPTFANALKMLDFDEAPEHVQSLIFQLPEAALQAAVLQTLQRFPNVKIGSYPKWEEKYLATEIRLRSKDLKELEQAMAFFQEELQT